MSGAAWRIHEYAIMKLGFDPIAFIMRMREKHPSWFMDVTVPAQIPDSDMVRGCKEASHILGRKVRWVHANWRSLPHKAVNGRVVLFSRAALEQLAQRKFCETAPTV